MLDDTAQDMGLVVRAQRRELAAGLRRRTAPSAAQIVDTQHAILHRIDRMAAAHELGPPSLFTVYDAVRRNTAEDRDDGGVRGSHEAKCDAGIRELVPVMQPP